MTEKQLMKKLEGMAKNELTHSITRRFENVVVNVAVNGDWPGEWNDKRDKCFGFNGEVFQNEDFVAYLFDLSLSKNIIDIWGDASDLTLNILVDDSKNGKTNITADVIEKLKSLVCTEEVWNETFDHIDEDLDTIVKTVKEFNEEVEDFGDDIMI